MPRHLALALALLLVIPLLGCGDDDDPTCPDTGDDPTPTLANIWPHADGTGWIYDLQSSLYAPAEGTGDAPPLPTMEELHAAAQLPVTEDLLEREDGLYRLLFDGPITSDTGITGQDLVESVYMPVEETKRAAAATDPLLPLLYRVRPDLRPRLAAVVDPEKALLEVPDGLYFMGAYVFAAEDTGYYGYGDINTQHAWTYLEGDLQPGDTWTLQLVPGITDDIWLHGRIWSVGDWSDGRRTWSNAVECLYLVDMGLARQTDEQGNLIATYRQYMYGITVFVPTVGPVSCLERRVLAPTDDILQDPFAGGTYEFRCTLAP